MEKFMLNIFYLNLANLNTNMEKDSKDGSVDYL